MTNPNKQVSFLKEARANKKAKNLRNTVSGTKILGEIQRASNELEKINDEIEATVTEIEEHIYDEDGNFTSSYTRKVTSLDKDAISIYQTRIGIRKLQIDTQLKLLNKILPDLKAVESTDDLKPSAERALEAFAAAAKQ